MVFHLRPPGDKSISHRAVLFASLCERESTIRGLLDGEDVSRTIHAVRALGAEVSVDGGAVRVRGGPWRDAGTVDCGNSGTTARLLAGALAPRAGATLVGDASLSRRPMSRVAEPLRAMGADIRGTGEDGRETLPLQVRAAKLRPIDWIARVPSAQVKSAVVLAAAGTEGRSTYTERVCTRDHTERMLGAMDARVAVGQQGEGRRIVVEGGGVLSPLDVDVPGDTSSAAFFLVAAAITARADVVVEQVGLNPLRTGVLDVLAAMGAQVEVERARDTGGEPVGTVVLRGRGLRGTTIAGAARIPTLVDELPGLAIAAAFAEGDTVIRDAAELRAKESDRIEAMAAGLRVLGVEVEVSPDGMTIRGRGRPPRGGVVDSAGDHRVAMAFSIAGLHVPVEVLDTGPIATSYPGFARDLERARRSFVG